MEEVFDLHQELVTGGGDDQEGFSGRIPGYGGACYSESSVVVAGGGWGEAPAPPTVVIGGEMAAGEETICSGSTIKSKIASHPLYPRLLDAYIDCQKVGAPPEMVSLLDEIRRGSNLKRPHAISSMLGADPELDQFMVTYCEVLAKYRSDLARPFDEATTFLNSVEKQLSNLCKDSALTSAEAARSSEEESSGGEVGTRGSAARREERELRDELLRRYSGYLSSLKQDFSKKKKKGNLPKEARQTLLDWWNLHYKWPYPTDADKLALVESTGLNQKQINNWFINQRKRRWKPSESMQFAVLDSLSSPFYLDG
ncbi:unnamed protein product [Spirodela intermedia]|uniref:Uncharacterized protein n=2 Tax=Spirodela intermedia TaxID=51605 RepID=A0A7I8J721_SPIIN|nr:unnamed protein product [Spirodela intermedia]CAA6665525.1 unnamed protein product [Spirodela intermedia]CAA7402258.1 unnamed protein product [Spirodela intermedia]